MTTAAPCRVEADLRHKEQDDELFAQRYIQAARNFDSDDIALEITQRFPESTTEIIKQLLTSDDGALNHVKLLGEQALDMAVREIVQRESMS